MERDEVTKLMANYEDSHDIGEYTLENINVWPLIRLWLAFRLYENIGIPGSQKRQPGGGCPLCEASVRIARKIGRLIHDRFSGKSSGRKKKTDAVLLTRSDRDTIVGDTYYNTIMDPISMTLEKNGISCVTWETGPRKSPRWREPLWISDSLDWNAGKGRILSLGDSFKNPPWLEEFLEFAKPLQENITRETVQSLLHNLFSYAAVFEKWLKDCRAKILIIDCWYNVLFLSASLAARRLGIPVIDVQHGLQGEGHFAYSHWKKRPKVDSIDLMPDRFWVWGRRDEKDLVSFNPGVITESRVFIGGNLWLEVWRRPGEYEFSGISKEVEEARSLTRGFEKTILVTLQKNLDFSHPLYPAIEKSPENQLWLIRLHRHTVDRFEEYEKQYQAVHHPHINLADATFRPLYALFQVADVHITGYSTCAMEALAFGLPTILLLETGKKVYQSFIDKGAFFYSDTPEALLDAIGRSGDVPHELCKECSGDVFSPGSRVVDVVKEMLSR